MYAKINNGKNPSLTDFPFKFINFDYFNSKSEIRFNSKFEYWILKVFNLK